jgi:hypothetical protein
MRATVAALYGGAFGDLAWAETRPLDAGGRAFEELDRHGIASSKVILVPD